ncbi:MAG: ferredoxin [Actinomycetota bacterium]|nr:ferredoxin [Actinomycetota bacterium]
MKAWVDADKCQGHTLCAMAAGEFFVLSDVDGHASAPNETVPPELEAKVRLAAGGCPEQAIVIEA